MIGREHKPEQVKHMMVLIEHYDGTLHGYEVFDGSCGWRWAGTAYSPQVGHGSAATVTVSGRFHRRNTSGIEMALRQQDEPR